MVATHVAAQVVVSGPMGGGVFAPALGSGLGLSPIAVATMPRGGNGDGEAVTDGDDMDYATPDGTPVGNETGETGTDAIAAPGRDIARKL
jgi:hypothetical protein